MMWEGDDAKKTQKYLNTKNFCTYFIEVAQVGMTENYHLNEGAGDP